jgi:hypothetical protein
MNVLSILQQQIGGLEKWPTYILLHLFLDSPDKRTIKNVSSFFYGNCVSKRIARLCYAMCNRNNLADTLTQSVSSLYETWKENPYKEHQAFYYDLDSECFVWVNGSGLSQNEIVIPEIKAPQIGVDCLKDIDYGLWVHLSNAIHTVLTNPTSFQTVDSSDEEDENVIRFDDSVLIYDEKTEKWRAV